MVVPIGAETFADALRIGVEVFHALKKVLTKRGLSTGVGDEGGFAPNLPNDEAALEAVMSAIETAGYEAGKDVAIALDPAASEFHEDGSYVFKKSGAGKKSAEEMIALYKSWIDRYPIVSIEDGLAEDDWEGWAKLTQTLGGRVQLVGDDIFCTNVDLLERGIDQGVANAILIKVNQIGTLTGTLQCIELPAFQGGEYGTLDWLQLRRQLAEERAALRALEVELDSLGRAARALETDPVAQERAAREQFGMIRPGELLYRLVPQVSPGSSAGSAPVRP